MNTKTMRLPPRRVLTPSSSLNKRKEREDGLDRPKPNNNKPLLPSPSSTTLTTTPKFLKPKPEPSPSSNQLLAGYLAHEFLTKGTLLGQPWDPARPPEGPTEPEKKKGKLNLSQISEAEPTKRAEPEKFERYVGVTDLFREDGTHLPGIVNPTQLARFLHL